MKVNTEKEQKLSIDRVAKLLVYCKDTGVLTLLIQRGPIKIGQRLGGIDKSSNYRSIMIDGVRYMEHRLIWFIVTGYWPKQVIDHIDGNRSNNIFSNLRDVLFRDNSANKVNNSKLGCNIREQHGNYIVTLSKNGLTLAYGTYKDLEHAKFVRNLVAECLDNNKPIPSKETLKDLAKNAKT